MQACWSAHFVESKRVTNTSRKTVAWAPSRTAPLTVLTAVFLGERPIFAWLEDDTLGMNLLTHRAAGASAGRARDDEDSPMSAKTQ